MKRPKYSILYVLHVMVDEIYDLGRIVEYFEYATINNPNVDVTLYVDLNFSSKYYDWDNSKVGKEYFYNLFLNYLSNSNKNLNIIHNYRDYGDWGVNSTRRNAIREYKGVFDYISFIDCDIMFDPDSVDYVYDTLEKVEGEFLIFSAMLPKMWNQHFDELTHPKFRNVTDRNFPFKINPLTVRNFHKTQKNNIIFLSDIAIGGGWFNVFSSNIFDYVDIPDELGVYGLDDHFIQESCRFLNKNGWDIKQCCNTKFIIFENHGRKFSIPDEFLVRKMVNNGKFVYEKETKLVYDELMGKYKESIIKKYF